MKVYYAYFQEYEDIHSVGIFTSKEKAEEALEHWYTEQTKDGGYCYYDADRQYVDEWELDEYWNENCTKLAKALK